MPLVIAPHSITLSGWESQTFQATHDGAVVSATWTLDPPQRGDIDAQTGVYRAPRWIPISKRVTVIAQSGAEFGTAAVELSASHTWIDRKSVV